MMIRSACQLRPSPTATVWGSTNRAGPTPSTSSMPVGDHMLAEALLMAGVVGRAAGVGQRGRQVDLWGWSPQPEGGPGVGVTHQPGGAGQGADRRWTPVETGPPDPVGLDQRDLGIELACLQGRGQAGRPATKYQ